MTRREEGSQGHETAEQGNRCQKTWGPEEEPCFAHRIKDGHSRLGQERKGVCGGRPGFWDTAEGHEEAGVGLRTGSC